MYHLSKTLFNNLIKEYFGACWNLKSGVNQICNYVSIIKTDCIRDTMKLILIEWDERPERHNIVY